MKVAILGADGYLGWPTAMRLGRRGHEVLCVDNYLRRRIAEQTNSSALIPTPDLTERVAKFKELTDVNLQVKIADCAVYSELLEVFSDFQPDAVIHYAEQPSAPYSMLGYREAQLTLSNNIQATFNVIWAVKEAQPDCHIIKLGTMGEYGTPNIDIEEGWLDITHKGRSDKFLFPRQAGSLYHTTKILDTDLLWFYVRTAGLRVTDLMQGPVYGLLTSESSLAEALTPNFHYDDIFGTVVNRFLVQAVVDIPLTIYGKGGQTRGYLNLNDTLQCVELALDSPVEAGELRILNQFTEQFSVLEIAEKISQVASKFGKKIDIQHLDNPRAEMEDHYYNATHSGLIELGLAPQLMTEDVLSEMYDKVQNYKSRIDLARVLPRVYWPSKRKS